MQAFLPVRLSALLLLAVSLGFGIESLRLGLWSYGMPGPGLTSFIGSLILLPISVGLLRAPLAGEDGEPLSVAALAGAVTFCVYVVALPVLGFAVATFLFLAAWAKGLFHRSLIVSCVSALATCVVIGTVFVLLLNVPIEIWPGWR